MLDTNVQKFLLQLTQWVATQNEIHGLLLVGSYAHGTADSQSDIDLIFFSDCYMEWVKNLNWIEQFGKIRKAQNEDWSKVKTVRVFFENALEAEFNFTDLSWASIDPLDPETERIISDGAKILYDPTLKLKKLLESLISKSNSQTR